MRHLDTREEEAVDGFVPRAGSRLAAVEGLRPGLFFPTIAAAVTHRIQRAAFTWSASTASVSARMW